MNIRYISIIILLLSVLSASADKKMTIRNSDTGESFEVSDPDGMRIYEYNSNWLDSIPYVLERARYGEPWAYEALGDCYRYGKGGVERSIFKAYFYYHLADMDIEQIAIESMAKNPTDQLGNTFILMEMLEHGNKQDVISFLETLNFKDNADLKVLRDFVIEPDTIILKHVVEQNIISGDSSTDKMMFTMFGCYYLNWFPDSFKEKSEIVAAAGNKLPYLYNEIAVKFFQR